jgi:hypothetical protein
MKCFSVRSIDLERIIAKKDNIVKNISPELLTFIFIPSDNNPVNNYYQVFFEKDPNKSHKFNKATLMSTVSAPLNRLQGSAQTRSSAPQ